MNHFWNLMSFHLSWHILVGWEWIPWFFVQFKGRSSVFSIGKVKGVTWCSPPGWVIVLSTLPLPGGGEVVVVLALGGPLWSSWGRGVPVPPIVLCVTIVTRVVTVQRGPLPTVHTGWSKYPDLPQSEDGCYGCEQREHRAEKDTDSLLKVDLSLL